MSSEISEGPASSGTYGLNYSSSLLSYPLAWICIVWEREAVYFHLLNYLLKWIFDGKLTEISLHISSKQGCAQEMPAVLQGIVGVITIIDTASSLELAETRKNVMDLYVGIFWSHILLRFHFHLFVQFCWKLPPGKIIQAYISFWHFS